MDAEFFLRNIKCLDACPVNTNAGGYVSMIADGRYHEAFALARSPNPLASICGMVCGHPCETACRRKDFDAPVAIRALKRFAVENGGAAGVHPEADLLAQLGLESLDRRPPNGPRAAIVGSGPAGLSAAHDLALMGARVTVFESRSVPGGMMVQGIPPFRLPRSLVESEVELLKDMGVEFKLNTTLGTDFSLADLKAEGFKGILLATGLAKSRILPLEGSDLEGVLGGIDFLREWNLGEGRPTGRVVVVIGGGGVATDVARTALRHGAEKVYLICLESREEMPADELEVRECEDEGVIILNRLGPRHILGKGQVQGLETVKCLRVFNEEGRFDPSFESESTTTIGCDTVILAVGQEADLSFITDADAVKTAGPGIRVDPRTLVTDAEGIFAAGDVAHGPRLIIDAIASGRRAARSMAGYLGINGWSEVRVSVDNTGIRPPTDQYMKIPRLPIPYREIGVSAGMEPREMTFTEAEARLEASRCLRCFMFPWYEAGDCILCGACADVCPNEALRIVPLRLIEPDDNLARQLSPILGLEGEQAESPLSVLESLNRSPVSTETSAMLKDDDACIRCGLCADRCPTGAMSMRTLRWMTERSVEERVVDVERAGVS